MRASRILTGTLTFALCFGLTGAVWADTVQGRVTASSRSAVDLVVYDPQGRPYPNALRLKVDPRTRFSGVSSASALRAEDPVAVEVSQESSGLWRADTITRLGASAPAPRAAKAPSASLMDALKSPTGQKMVRSGLLGAATGAVAAKSSGGKAGKGALVGAGVGIAGGLLEGLFSQPAQKSQTAVAVDEDSRY